mgnify:CR=1
TPDTSGKRHGKGHSGRNGVDSVVTGRQRRHPATIEATPRKDEATRYKFK